MEGKKSIKKKITIPHSYALIFSILIIVTIATWLIPGGAYERVINEAGRTVVLADSFKFIESIPRTIWDLLKAPFEGFVAKADIIAFIFIVGGAFNVIQGTNAINTGISNIVKKLKGKEILIIPITILLFSIAGAVIGMSEETIPFVGVFVPLALALGYDSFTGMGMVFVGAGVGFASAMLNPFTVGVAKGIAETPLKAGMVYRTVVWIIITSFTIFYMMRYARKVKANPESSILYEHDLKRREELSIGKENGEEEVFFLRHRLVLITVLFGLGLIIFGVLKYEWYIEEIAAVFLALGIIAGFIGKLSAGEIADYFIAGAKDMISAALIVGLANAIVILCNDAKIMDTILYGLAKVIEPLPTLLSGYVMLIVQTIINFFVGSGTGQAALTIPIMYPLGELVNISRETTILIYQFGDGFTNLIIPTSGVLMATLGMAKIPYDKWVKWVVRFLLFMFILQIILVTPAILFPWLLS